MEARLGLLLIFGLLAATWYFIVAAKKATRTNPSNLGRTDKLTVSQLLEVPFSEKDIAKGLGAKWSPDLKKWYVAHDLNPQPFQRWKNTEKPIVIKTEATLCFMLATRSCWKCGKETPVLAMGAVPHAAIWLEEDYFFIMFDYIERMPSDVREYLKVAFPTYRMGYSKTMERSYYMNHCADKSCGAHFGDHHTQYSFMPADENEAEKLTLIESDFPLSYTLEMSNGRDDERTFGEFICDHSFSTHDLIWHHARRANSLEEVAFKL